MKKILFLIHDLGHGGAEKVLVNLVNNMDTEKFDITVIALFGGGVNEQFLKPHIHYKSIFRKVFPGNSHVMKLFSPGRLHKWFITEHYDVEISYLEGPSARIISGCKNESTKLVSWIHVQQENMEHLAGAFRSQIEAHKCYERFDQTVCVSEYVKKDFCTILDFKNPCCVLYNTVESDEIIRLSKDEAVELRVDGKIRMIAVGTLKESKGYDRMLRIVKKLCDNAYPVHLYILGEGPQKAELERYVQENRLIDSVTFLGYNTNPYKYVAKSDLFVCASLAEGFSTATTESLIVSTPVCTVEVSGMKEMLGENNEWGIVTENDEEKLYWGIKKLLDDPQLLAHYKEKAMERGKIFNTENTVKAVEHLILDLLGN